MSEFPPSLYSPPVHYPQLMCRHTYMHLAGVVDARVGRVGDVVDSQDAVLGVVGRGKVDGYATIAGVLVGA